MLQDEPDGGEEERAGRRSHAVGHLPGQGAEQVASQSYVPPEPRDDKALIAAGNMLRNR